MRNEPNLRVENYRVQPPGFETEYGVNHGTFQIGECFVISSGSDHPGGLGWEHVSVSTKRRCPTWTEVDRIKKLFWRDDETVVQFHPREDLKINFHPYCLHLWKKIGEEYQLPPKELVGP